MTSLLFALGERVWFSKGSTANIKITTKDELRMFEGWVLYEQRYAGKFPEARSDR